MREPLERRGFLKITCGLAASTLVLGRAGKAHTDSSLPRTARLFPGCCAYSYARLFDQHRMTMQQFILSAVELGVQGVDLTAYWLKSTDREYLVGLRRLAFGNGVAFSGVAMRTEMCLPPGAGRERELENIRKWVDATNVLGASHLRVFAGNFPPGVAMRDGITWVADTMKYACDYSARQGVVLGLEDHHGITARAEQVLEVVRQVDSPFAAINLDIENFDVTTEEERYSDIEACLPFASHIHIRDTVTKTHRPIDLDRVGQLLANAGYKGFVSAEYEGDEDPVTAVPKLVAEIKRLCRKYSSI